MTVHLDDPARLEISRYIRPGSAIVMGQAAGEPTTVADVLAAQRASISGSSIFLGSGFSGTFKPEHADHLRFSGFGAVGTMRKLVNAGVLDPIPCHVSSIGPMIASGAIACDVALVQVSAANEKGEHSFGMIADYVREAVRKASVVIAEVNRRVPWTPCDDPLRTDEIDVCLHTDAPLIEVPPAPFGEREKTIAALVAAEIPDRATLQLGIGAIPEAIFAGLMDHRDLGIHSGMIGDAAATLMEAGVVTNAFKGIDEGLTVTGSLIGTSKLYRFADRNPAVVMRPSSYTHQGGHLARLRHLVSINSALEVDLSGQVNAEAIGSDYFGAVGGQVDFVRMAAGSSGGGLSVIALPAVDKNGASKIVARLSGPVTTARSDVDAIATEFGMVRLRGMTLRQRARALAGIAAPQHREALLREAHDPLQKA